MLGNGFQDFWPKVSERLGNRALRNENFYDIPTNLAFESLKRFPMYSFPTAYNALSLELKMTPKLITFTNVIKKNLIP